jgi:hypothetical protein
MCGHKKNYCTLEEDNGDKQIQMKIKPQQTEIGFGPQQSVCSGCTVSSNHHEGDDSSRD